MNRYRTIVADPPWPVHAMRRANVLRGDHYPVMQIDEIKALAVGELAADDASRAATASGACGVVGVTVRVRLDAPNAANERTTL